jgi:predicted RecB family nuclease
MCATTPTRITAQDFYDFDKCPHRVYLNRFGDPKEKLPNSDFLNLLFENALRHERDVIADMIYETPEGSTLEERAVSTLQLMQAGADRIYQGVFLQAGESGIPDLLEKVDGNSKFGSYFYRPVDIKAGSGYENQEKGTLRNDYGMQLYHYGMLLEAAQGLFPPDGDMLNRYKERVPYRLDEFRDLYNETLPEVRALVTGAKTDEPALCGECGSCQWWGVCEKALANTNDVTLLPDVGRSKKTALNGAGIKSISDIPTFDFSQVSIKGIGQKTIDSMKQAAISVLSNKLQVLSKPVLPDPPRKIYLDFEDDPTQDLIYLCGMWIEPPLDGLNYHGLFCTDEAGEAKIWADFQNICAAMASEDYVVFHYSGYEKAKLTSLERKYGANKKAALELFKGRMVDLFPLVKQNVVVPARGYGLKQIAPFAGLKHSAENAGGAQSIVWFQKYQADQNRRDVLETLLTYNQEDCLVMKYVEGWLRGL